MSQQLDEIEEQLEQAEESTNQYLDENMTMLVNTFVIPEMQAIARAINVPEGFIDGIKFVKTGQNTGKIINTWGTQEKPLAKWFNYGTKDHFIAPVIKKALHWITPMGSDAFSKGHMIRGLPKTLAMEIGLEQGMKRLKSSVHRREEVEQ